jgi:UDP-N-acetylglucosamine:LPS N-acetylglucosamine transferase
LEEGSSELRQVRRVLQIASRRLAEATAGADVVVSTHPFASQILGEQRRRRTLGVPAVTYLTDASVHPLWVHPFVDRHLAWNMISAGQARGWGGDTTVIDPLVSCRPEPAWAPSTTAAHLRRTIGVDDGRPTALIVGGSLGIGSLMATARDVLATGLAHPIVLCGANDALRRRTTKIPGVIGLGWRDDLPAILRSVDVVVQNSGGFTSLEAMAVRAPLVSYRVLPGHGAQNAAALENLGAAPWARSSSDLRTMLGLALLPAYSPPPLPTSGVDLLDVLFPQVSHVVPRAVATCV